MKIELELMNNSPSKIDSTPQGDYRVFVDGAELMRLELTCHACPEQYDLKSLLDNKQLAYMRLRWSNFTCSYPDVGGEELVDEYINEDGWSGSFYNEEQRVEYLSKAIELVVKKIRDEEPCSLQQKIIDKIENELLPEFSGTENCADYWYEKVAKILKRIRNEVEDD